MPGYSIWAVFPPVHAEFARGRRREAHWGVVSVQPEGP